jgi:hypothetical protein
MVFLAGTGKSRQSNIYSRSHFCHGKAISIQYSECMSLFLPTLSSMQSTYVPYYIVTYVACLAVPYFSTWSHKSMIFGQSY